MKTTKVRCLICKKVTKNPLNINGEKTCAHCGSKRTVTIETQGQIFDF